MRSLAIDILRALSTQGPCTVAALGAACAAPPAQVERRLARLAASGWIGRHGERIALAEPFDYLDAGAIAAAMNGHAAGAAVRVLDACPSTNSELLDQAPRTQPCVLLAEEQTAGRGRRGRRWLSCIGGGLALSVGRAMSCAPHDLATLSLASGVACVRALRGLGASGVTLKWPNDLLLDGAKLGGILTETRVRGRTVMTVIGVGLNCQVVRGLEARLGRRVASLADCLRPMVSRNVVAGRIAGELLGALERYEREGAGAFAGAFRADWEALDAYRGQRLRVRLATGRIVAGMAEGLAEDGALRLRTRSGVRAIRGGRVVRARAA